MHDIAGTSTWRASPAPGVLARTADRLRHPDVWAVATIVAVATLVRIGFAASAPPFVNPDGEGYYLPAHDLVHGLPFQPDLRRTPAYPFFIAAVIWLFGEDLQRLIWVQHLVVGPPSAALTYALGRLLTGRLVALAAGLWIALSGPMLLYEHYVLTDGLFTLLLLLTLAVATWAARRANLGWAAVSGLLFGVTILCRPAGQVLAPVLALLLLLGGGPLRRRLAAVALCGALAALVVLPWMASNYARHGVFAVSGSGRFLLARVVKNDPGGYSFEAPPGVVEDERKTAARRVVRRESLRDRPGSVSQRLREELGMTEAQTSRLLTDLAVEAIRERPGYYVAQTVEFAWQIMAGEPIDVRREGMPWREIDWERRIRHVLERPVNRLDVPRAQLLVNLHDPARYGPLVPILFGAGLVLAAVGLAPRRLLLLGLIAVALIVSSAALVGPVLRYRVPADPFIALLSVQAVATLAGLASAMFKAGRYPPRRPIEEVELPTEAART